MHFATPRDGWPKPQFTLTNPIKGSRRIVYKLAKVMKYVDCTQLCHAVIKEVFYISLYVRLYMLTINKINVLNLLIKLLSSDIMTHCSWSSPSVDPLIDIFLSLCMSALHFGWSRWEDHSTAHCARTLYHAWTTTSLLELSTTLLPMEISWVLAGSLQLKSCRWKSFSSHQIQDLLHFLQ